MLALVGAVGLGACAPPSEDTVIPTMMMLPTVTATTLVEPTAELPTDVPASPMPTTSIEPSPTAEPTLTETASDSPPRAGSAAITETISPSATAASTATSVPTQTAIPTLAPVITLTRTAIPTLPPAASPTPTTFVLVQPPINPRQGDEYVTPIRTLAPATQPGRVIPPTRTLTPSLTYTATATNTLSAPPTDSVTLVPATPYEPIPTLDRPIGSTPPPGSDIGIQPTPQPSTPGSPGDLPPGIT